MDQLSEYSFAIVQDALKYQADAWQRYFKGTANRPDFHKKHKHTDSFTATQDLFKIVEDSVYPEGWLDEVSAQWRKFVLRR